MESLPFRFRGHRICTFPRRHLHHWIDRSDCIGVVTFTFWRSHFEESYGKSACLFPVKPKTGAVLYSCLILMVSLGWDMNSWQRRSRFDSLIIHDTSTARIEKEGFHSNVGCIQMLRYIAIENAYVSIFPCRFCRRPWFGVGDPSWCFLGFLL